MLRPCLSAITYPSAQVSRQGREIAFPTFVTVEEDQVVSFEPRAPDVIRWSGLSIDMIGIVFSLFVDFI
jgi:hypothetical protein